MYYADFDSAENHGVSPVEVLFTHSHTCEYAEAILSPNETPFSARLQKLLEDEIWNFNLLILDRVEILPKYRGAGVVGMKPFPYSSSLRSPVIPRGGRNV